ncbi:MAG: hypothetical protein KDG89_14290 [Geminicoccaceae bacterium]|nr:hypothetical protein [Geminicoccaceae bacterium]
MTDPPPIPPSITKKRPLLFAWEHGRGGGYAARLGALAAALRARGHPVLFALREAPPAGLAALGPVLPVPGGPYAPPPLPPGERFFRPVTFADLLARGGFEDPDWLAAALSGWDALLRAHDPALVVAEGAPALCLAAHGRLPVVQIGTGYAVPPVEGAWFPRFRDGRPYAAQPGLLARVRAARRGAGRPPPGRLTDFWRATVRLVHGFPSLDPYHGRRPPDRRERGIGPFLPLPGPLPPPAAPAVLAYLDPGITGFAAIVEALAALKVPGPVLVPRAAPGLVERLRRLGLDARTAMPPLAEALAAASHVVHHAGLETTMAALATGRPQFLLPRNTAQSVAARPLLERNLAWGCRPVPSAEVLTRLLRAFVADATIVAWAGEVAAEAAAAGPYDGLGKAVAACEAVLAARDPSLVG